MAKNKGKKKSKEKFEPAEIEAVVAAGAVDETAEASEPKPKMSRKEFEKELEKLQVELVKMQEWVKASGAKVCVLFEGRDAAGKGGIIKRITERTSPRVFRVVALPRRPSGRSRRCTSSATCPICRRPAKSCSSTAVGTTGPASSG